MELLTTKYLIVTNRNNMQTLQEFKEKYIAKLKTISPQQPDRWYQYQSECNYKLYLKRLS